jgi:hypothetical protein
MVEREKDGVVVASWWFHDEGRWVGHDGAIVERGVVEEEKRNKERNGEEIRNGVLTRLELYVTRIIVSFSLIFHGLCHFLYFFTMLN